MISKEICVRRKNSFRDYNQPRIVNAIPRAVADTTSPDSEQKKNQ